MHLQRHFQQAVSLVSSYKGDVPFAAYLKQYFVLNKKHGLTDRKNITRFCYAYFRLGRAIDTSVEDQMKIGIFLSENAAKYSELFDEAFQLEINATIDERIVFVENKFPGFKRNAIFPFNLYISSAIDISHFIISHLQQPDIFVRIRPGKELAVEQQLKSKDVDFNMEAKSIRFSPNTKVEQLLKVNKDVVIQDINSQRVWELIEKVSIDHSPFKVWDCCAASGGKSILALDMLQSKTSNLKFKLELTVTDVRSTILHNLQKRFSEAGITNFRSFVADLTKPINNNAELFDLIICDAPCSGSGTWGRTPEQLFLFTEDKIEYYSNLQRSIVSNAVKQLNKNGYFLYITCSVFTDENESVVSFISEELKVKLVEMKYFKGYNQKADTLFAALFTV